MIPGKMEQHYFDEKKELAIEGVEHASQTAAEIMGLLSSWSYRSSIQHHNELVPEDLKA